MPNFSPYRYFSKKEWANLRFNTPMTLTQTEIEELQGVNEKLSVEEITTIYLPLTRLLNLYVNSSQMLHAVTDTFFGNTTRKVPYVIGVAGSVAVGKSTTARIIQALLSRWPNTPSVEIITTDGFLYPNDVLNAKGIMDKKGFPESYKPYLRSLHAGKSLQTAVRLSTSSLRRLPSSSPSVVRPPRLSEMLR